MFTSMIIGKCTELCSYYHNLVLKDFRNPQTIWFLKPILVNPIPTPDTGHSPICLCIFASPEHFI